MAVKVVVEGTGTWVGLRRGERRSYLLTDVVQRRIDRGFYSVVERSEIADHTPPPAPAGPADSGSTTPSDESPEPPADDPTQDADKDPAPKPRRSRRTGTDDDHA